MKRALGVCYYPEHWPETQWPDDAARMVDLGLRYVRIGEFSWSVLEPEPGDLQWGWLDRAFEVLSAAGLQIVLGTPTATPPRWMLDKHPDMLAWDADGRPRGFGSRRHYCFSHQGYLSECQRITALMAERYGRHPALYMWQTDNEYGCHDTTFSYSPAARLAFQKWLEARYETIDALNAAWGNVFWSMHYNRFDQIDLPNLTVTEPNPSHALDFRRFSSDQVRAFNQVQVAEIRRHSTAPISHNFMGRVTDFDHFALGSDIEVATWDSYPLGFLEDRAGASAALQMDCAQQGDPDFQAFHHDLYRAVCGGRWWIMEQQPGPVNWAPHNPAPLPGMVRLWTWEAFAHGAEAVSYFRWRQVPFGQEQNHAGLLRPDSNEAAGFAEAKAVASELLDAPEVQAGTAPVGLIFDYDAEAAWAVQPQGAGLSYFDLVYQTYQGLRRAGQSVDILPPTTRDFSAYAIVFAPGLAHLPPDLGRALSETPARVVLGPRAGALTESFAIPADLPPAIPGAPCKVARIETIRRDTPRALKGGGAAIHWVETLEGGAPVLSLADGSPVAVRAQEGGPLYLGAWLDAEAMDRLMYLVLEEAGLRVCRLPDELRMRETQTERFFFNYGAHPVSWRGRDLGAADMRREDKAVPI